MPILNKKLQRKIKHWRKKRRIEKIRSSEEDLKELQNELYSLLNSYQVDEKNISPFDFVIILRKIRDLDKTTFINTATVLPEELLALILLELPLSQEEELIDFLGI